MSLMRRYRVKIRFNERVVGGIPIVPEGADQAAMYEKWARGQGVENDPSFEKPLAAALADDPDMPVAVADIEGLATGFRRDDDGIYIEARQVKAMIREAAQRLGIIQAKRGVRQVLQHDLHVRAAGTDHDQRLRFQDADGEWLTEPSGIDSRPISVVTRQGPRTTIKRFEYVEAPLLGFDVLVLRDGVGGGLFDGTTLGEVLGFGSWLGLGADRSQGEGTFNVESIEEV